MIADEDQPAVEAARAAWNTPRYRRHSRGMYEVWFLTACDPASQLGLWIRYTISVSSRGEGQAGLWLAAFDRRHPSANLAHRQMFPLEELQVGATGVAIGGECGGFDGRRLVGLLEDGGRRISWDLVLAPQDEPTPMLPRGAYRSRLIQTKFVGVTLDARLSGAMTIGEQTWDFDDIPAAQSHIWGSRHAHAWTWAHCNAFDAPGVVFEGLTARVERLGMCTPPLSQLYLRVGDREYPLIGWWRALRLGGEVASGPSWAFCGRGEGIEVRGRAFCRPEDMVGVDYHDPDGAPLVCYNSEVASMELEVRYRGTNHYERFVSDGTTAFEFAGRDLVQPSASGGLPQAAPR